MKRMFSQNVQVAASGAIGAPADTAASVGALVPRPSEGASGKQRATYDYATSANNFATKVQEPAQIGRVGLNQYQNRNKSLLQYRHQFDKMRGFRGQYGSSTSQGFKGFGRPVRSEGPKAAGGDDKGKAERAAKAGAPSKTQEIAEKKKGTTIGQALQQRQKSLSRTKAQQGGETVNRTQEIALRREKTTFLRELISMRSEVGRQQSQGAAGPLGQLTLGDQATLRGLPPSSLGLPWQVQEKRLKLDKPTSALKDRRAILSENSTPLQGSAQETGADVIYSLTLGQPPDGVQDRSMAGARAGSGPDGGRPVGNQLIMIQLQDGNAAVAPVAPMATDERQADADGTPGALLALPEPKKEPMSKKARELQEKLGQAVASEVLSEKRRITAEIKDLQGRIAKAFLPRKARRKKDRAARSGGDEAQVSGGAGEGEPANAQSPGPGADEEAGYSANAFMTQYPQGAADMRYDEELRVDLRCKEMAEFKKSKTWRENEQKVKKCLAYLGIKDKHLLDHFYPGFQRALENKINENFRQNKDGKQEGQLLAIGPDETAYEWVELYGGRGNGAKRKPINRTAALRGSGPLPLQREQSQEPKRLKVCKFKDQELQMMCYRSFQNEKAEWKKLQQLKDKKTCPYMEPVAVAEVSALAQQHKTQTAFNKAKRHRLHVEIMKALEEARRQSGIVEDAFMLEDLEELFDPEQFVGEQFKGLSLEELQNYLHQTLQIQMSQTDAALQSLSARQGTGRAVEEAFPSYKERAAFIQTLKRKWMLQKGYCSAFDRLREQRLLKQKALRRREELEDRKKRRRKLVVARLQRTSSGQELPAHRQRPLEASYRSKSSESHQMETAKGRRHDGRKGKRPGDRQAKVLQPSRSKQVVDEVGLEEFALLAGTSKRPLQEEARLRAPRPRTSSPSKSQLWYHQAYNQDIHELTRPSPDRQNQSPKSLKEWTDEKPHGQSLDFPQKAQPHLNSSLTLPNTLGQPPGVTIQARVADFNQMSRDQQHERLGRLYDVAKQDMETLERLLSHKQPHGYSQEDSQDTQEALLGQTQGQQQPRRAQLAQIVSDGAIEHASRGPDHQTMPYSDLPRSKDKSSEVHKRTTGNSSLVLSPQAKVELIEASKGDVFRRARELENQLDLAEKGMSDPKQLRATSTINSPEGGNSLRERIVVHMADPEKAQDVAEARQQESIQAKLALYQTQAQAQIQKVNLQFQEPLAVREVSPDVVHRVNGPALPAQSRLQPVVAPKEYRSAHARRQRDIKRLLDSKQGAEARTAAWERAGPQAQYRTQRDERDTMGGKSGGALEQDGVLGAMALTQAKASSQLRNREGEPTASPGAQAGSGLRTALNQAEMHQQSSQYLRMYEYIPSQHPLAKPANLESSQQPWVQPANKESASDPALSRGLRAGSTGRGGLQLQGRQVVGLAQPKDPRGMPDEANSLLGRPRSRDQGTMSGGLNGDLSTQVGKVKQERRNTDLLRQLNVDPSSRELAEGGPQAGRQPQGAVEGYGAQHELEQDDERRGGSSFGTKRRSDPQTSLPEARAAAMDPEAPSYPARDVDRASSALSKTGPSTKNILAAQAYMSAPSAPEAVPGGSELPGQRIRDFAGSSGPVKANELPEKQHGPGLDVSQQESSLTQYLVPGQIQKNYPIVGQYQPQTAANLAVMKQKTSLESSTRDAAFLKSKLDLVHQQQAPDEAGVEAGGVLMGPPKQKIFYGGKRSEFPKPSGLAPSASVTILAATSAAAQSSATTTSKPLLADQQQRLNKEKYFGRAPERGEGGARAASAAAAGRHRARQRAELLSRREAQKPVAHALEQTAPPGRPPLARHLNFHLDTKAMTQANQAGSDARAAWPDAAQESQGDYAVFVMPYVHVGHAKVPNQQFHGGQPEFTKFIHNEPYFSRMARINPEPFAISGQGIRGQYMTPKQMALLQQQSRTKALRHRGPQAEQRDQKTGEEEQPEPVAGPLPSDPGPEPQTQPSERRTQGALVLAGQGPEHGGRALKFPSVHIHTQNGQAITMQPGDREQAIHPESGPGRRRLQNKGAGSAVTAELPADGQGPPSFVQAQPPRKAERERRSHEGFGAEPQAMPRLSIQGTAMGSAAKAPVQAVAESLSEVSPAFRLPHNFDHDMLLSGDHNADGYDQLLSVQQNEGSIHPGREEEAEDPATATRQLVTGDDRSPQY